jgi:hypothetical protein
MHHRHKETHMATKTAPLLQMYTTAAKLQTELQSQQASLGSARFPYSATKGLQRLQGEWDTLAEWENEMDSQDEWAETAKLTRPVRLVNAYRAFAKLATRHPAEDEAAYAEGVRAALTDIADALARVDAWV